MDGASDAPRGVTASERVMFAVVAPIFALSFQLSDFLLPRRIPTRSTTATDAGIRVGQVHVARRDRDEIEARPGVGGAVQGEEEDGVSV